MKASRRTISPSVADAYKFYFSLDIIEESFAPNICCLGCVTALLGFMKRERIGMPFGLPMIWQPVHRHSKSTCYVCVNKKVLSCGRIARSSIKYEGTMFVTLPIPHSDALPVPRYPSPKVAAQEPLTKKQQKIQKRERSQQQHQPEDDFFGFEPMSVGGIQT